MLFVSVFYIASHVFRFSRGGGGGGGAVLLHTGLYTYSHICHNAV